MAHYHDHRPHEHHTRWHLWVALVSGIATGYALLMGLFLTLA